MTIEQWVVLGVFAVLFGLMGLACYVFWKIASMVKP